MIVAFELNRREFDNYPAIFPVHGNLLPTRMG
jgi:hypothetical protein